MFTLFSGVVLFPCSFFFLAPVSEISRIVNVDGRLISCWKSHAQNPSPQRSLPRMVQEARIMSGVRPLSGNAIDTTQCSIVDWPSALLSQRAVSFFFADRAALYRHRGGESDSSCGALTDLSGDAGTGFARMVFGGES